MVGVVEVDLGLVVMEMLHTMHHVPEISPVDIKFRLQPLRYLIHLTRQLFMWAQSADNTSGLIPFHLTAVYLILTLTENLPGRLGQPLVVAGCIQPSAADAGGHALGSRVVVLRVAMVGDDHVGRRGNIEITLTGGLGGYVASIVHCINMLGCFHNAEFAVLLYRHPLGDR